MYDVLSTLGRELNKWLEIGENWNDRESARIEAMIIAPLSFRINRLQEQADEMIDFITAIERELDEIERVSGEGG